MIDVFLCSCAADGDWIRRGLLTAVQQRWSDMPNVKLWPYYHWQILSSKSLMQYQGMRRTMVESQATSPIYIMAEDDVMPWGPDFVERGVAVLNRHPEFAVLSPLLFPFPEKPTMWEDDECYEGITSGGINFTRKGVMADMQVPENELFDESSQAGWLKRHGWKTGWMKKVRALHLGAGHSTIWPEPYTGVTQIVEP